MISKLARAATAVVLGLSAWLVAGLAPGPTARAEDAAPLAAPPPLAAYGHLPSIEQVAISPDGQFIAVINTDGEARRVLVTRLPDLSLVRGINGGDQKIRSIQWAGSHHLLITISHTVSVADLIAPRSEWSVIADFNIDKGTLKPVLGNVENSMNVSLDTPIIRVIDGHPFAFIQGMHFVENMGRISLFKADLDHSNATLVDPGFENTRHWVVDQVGQPLAEMEYDRNERPLLRVRRGGVWRVVRLGDGKSYPSLLGLGRDGKTILLSDNADDKPALRELASGGEDWGESLSPLDSEHPIFDPADDHLIGAYALVGDTDDYEFFAPHDQAVWRGIQKAYLGCRVTLQSWSTDRKRLIVLTDCPSYAYVDLATGKATWIGDTYRTASASLAPVAPVAFKASDGTPLTGYLTLPPGKTPKNLPLVVFPHGGPAARDEPGFDWWAQAMASRGYAVLQVNYRGSDGFGWKFLSSGFGQWGRAMQTDLSDGVRALAIQGKIDPKRVCIVGASYGGYAALAGATLQPEVYRCAVSVAGPAELRRFAAWSREQSDISAQRYWLNFMGADGLHDVKLEDISPADHADQVTGPVLLIHGKDDTVVPFAQTQIMADALKKAGKPYDLVVLKREDHWLSRGESRLQMLQAIIDFLQKNNPPS
ncbi:MAG TPA: S9 family peptidase [Caulobacteraceae bacterium]